jgi:hypothetical protein
MQMQLGGIGGASQTAPRSYSDSTRLIISDLTE